jgi:AraC family transcriptional regulator
MPAAVVLSSRNRNWHGVEVMIARIAQQELEVDSLPMHTIAINTGRPFRLESSVEGRENCAWMTSGAIKIVEAGPRSRWRWDRGDPIEMLHLSVSAAQLHARARELEVGREPELITQVGFEDLHLLRLANAFVDELHELRPTATGSLMSDALRIELLLRLLGAHSSLAGMSAIRLPAHRLGMNTLRRLDEFIDAHLGDDIGIADLAVVAGVSRFHFARMFKATTGMTPYHYVLEQRTERARALLRRSALSIRDVAIVTGFADQSHLTRHVKRRYGVTPRAYRAS